MIDERRAFIAAIKAAPDDDAPRLIFADWLDERGEAERAEFIRVQCKLASMYMPDGKHVKNCYIGGCAPGNADKTHPCKICGPLWKLRRRERELTSGENCRLVTPEFPLLMCCNATFEGHAKVRHVRGFVDSLDCSAADWLQHGDAILAEHPVREVRLDRIPTEASFPYWAATKWKGVAFIIEGRRLMTIADQVSRQSSPQSLATSAR